MREYPLTFLKAEDPLDDTRVGSPRDVHLVEDLPMVDRHQEEVVEGLKVWT